MTKDIQKLAIAVLGTAISDVELATTEVEINKALAIFSLDNPWFVHWCSVAEYDAKDLKDRVYAKYSYRTGSRGYNQTV